MASDVDVCNLALSHIGDDATVSSIIPPEGSAQAEHCSRFYPVARDSLLQMHDWGFATTRTVLAAVAITPPAAWAYAYALPAGLLKILAIYDPTASDDYSTGFPITAVNPMSVNTGSGIYTPQPYTVESIADGSGVIYTNQINAVLRYTAQVTDSAKFSPLFVTALSWLLASHLAGPVLKGSTGAQAAKGAMDVFQYWLSLAKSVDGNQRHTDVKPSTPWMVNR